MISKSQQRRDSIAIVVDRAVARHATIARLVERVSHSIAVTFTTEIDRHGAVQCHAKIHDTNYPASQILREHGICPKLHTHCVSGTHYMRVDHPSDRGMWG